jgi:hypothetical protein
MHKRAGRHIALPARPRVRGRSQGGRTMVCRGLAGGGCGGGLLKHARRRALLYESLTGQRN